MKNFARLLIFLGRARCSSKLCWKNDSSVLRRQCANNKFAKVRLALGVVWSCAWVPCRAATSLLTGCHKFKRHSRGRINCGQKTLSEIHCAIFSWLLRTNKGIWREKWKSNYQTTFRTRRTIAKIVRIHRMWSLQALPVGTSFQSYEHFFGNQQGPWSNVAVLINKQNIRMQTKIAINILGLRHLINITLSTNMDRYLHHGGKGVAIFSIHSWMDSFYVYYAATDEVMVLYLKSKNRRMTLRVPHWGYFALFWI